MPRIFIIGEELEPKAKFGFDLNQLDIMIGSTESNHITISDDKSISNQHCVIRRVFGGYVIKDLDSSNGISQLGKRIDKAEVENASIFTVGDTEIRFSLTKDEIKKLQKEPKRPAIYITKDFSDDIQKLHDGEIDELPYDIDELIKNKSKKKEEDEDIIDLSDDDDDVIDLSDLEIEGDESRPKIVTGEGSGQSTRSPHVAPMNYGKKGPNVAALLIISIILGAVGFIGGLALKHSNLHGANFFSDFSEGKLK